MSCSAADRAIAGVRAVLIENRDADLQELRDRRDALRIALNDKPTVNVDVVALKYEWKPTYAKSRKVA